MHFRKHDRKTVAVALVVIGLGCLIWRPLLGPGLMATHDGENHLARFANYYLAVKQGQIPPRFAPNLFNKYGYPVFNFNYPLANIFSLPFSIVQINYEITYKVLTILSVIGGSLGIYFWLKRISVRVIPILLAIAAYVSTPYLLSSVLFRGSIGEVMVFGLLPWLFWLIEWMKTSTRLTSLVIGVPLLSALLLAHNVTGLLAGGILVVTAVVTWGKRITVWQTAGFVVLMSLGLTLWFWLPALLENQTTILLAARVQNEYQQHFVSLHQLVFSPLTFGYSLVGPVDSLSLSIGWVSVVTLFSCVLVVSVWVLLTKQMGRVMVQKQAIYLVLIGLSLLLLCLQLLPAQVLWEKVGFLRVIQFPWRLSLFVPILLLPVFAFLLHQPSKVLRGILLVGLVMQLCIALRVPTQPTIHHSNEEYEAAAYSTSTQNENRPRDFTFEYFNHESDWAATAQIISGVGTIESVKNWNGSRRTYSVNASTPVTIVEPTMYFAGWQTTLRDLSQSIKPVQVQYLDSAEIGGRIAFQILTGRYQVTTRFTQDTPPRKVGNILCIFTLCAYGYVWWRYWQSKKQLRHK